MYILIKDLHNVVKKLMSTTNFIDWEVGARGEGMNILLDLLQANPGLVESETANTIFKVTLGRENNYVSISHT